MKFKGITAITLALMMILSISGCNNSKEQSQNPGGTTPITSKAPETTPEVSETPRPEGIVEWDDEIFKYNMQLLFGTAQIEYSDLDRITALHVDGFWDSIEMASGTYNTSDLDDYINNEELGSISIDLFNNKVDHNETVWESMDVFDDVSKFINLEYLEISNIGNLKFLRSTPKLKVLILSGYKGTDIFEIENCQELEAILIYSNDNTFDTLSDEDLQVFSKISNLKVVGIDGSEDDKNKVINRISSLNPGIKVIAY